jgi:hypothetical protein
VLILKGTSPRFKLEDGKWVSGRGLLLFHDPHGTTWGKCSALAMHGRKEGREPDRENREARFYLGRTHNIKAGRIDVMPPRALGDWERVGKVERLEYSRTGKRSPGRYFHNFGHGRWFRLFIPGKLPTLYRRGSALRLEMPSCVWTDRGIEHP